MLNFNTIDSEINDLILYVSFNPVKSTFEISVTIDFEIGKFNYGVVSLDLSKISTLDNLDSTIYQFVLKDISINLFEDDLPIEKLNFSKSQPFYSNFIVSNNSLITNKNFFINIFINEDSDVTVYLNISKMKDIVFNFILKNQLSAQNKKLQIIKIAEQYILELTKFDKLLNSSIKSFFYEYFIAENKDLFKDYIIVNYVNDSANWENLINEFIIVVNVDKQETFLNLNITISGTDKDNEYNMQIDHNKSIKLSFNYLQNHLQNYIMNELYHFRYDFEDAIWQFNYKNFDIDYEIRNKFRVNLYKNDFTFKQLQQSVAYNLQTLRKERNYTQEKLAELSNCSTITIGAIETQTRAPSLKLIFSLSKSLEVNINEFFY